MAAIQIGQPNYGLLNTSAPAEAALAPIKGMGAVNALRSQQLQNEASQFEMQNALAEQEAYKRAAQGEGSVTQNLMSAGLGGKAAAYQKATADALKTQGDALKSRIEQSRFALEGVRTPEQYLQWHIANHQDPVLGQWLASRGITPQQSMQKIQAALQVPGGFDNLLMESKLGVEKMLSTTLRQQEADTASKRLQFEMNPEQQGRVSAAKAGGAETGKTSAQAAANLPSAIQTANEAITLIDEMVGKEEVKNAKGEVIQKATAPHPGFESYVGATWLPGQRFLEGSDAASYEVRQKQIEGQAFLEAFRSLKGGGSITEKEGEKATAAITRMNKASSEKEYIQAARELQQILRTGVENAKKKAARGTVGGGPLPKNKWAEELAKFDAEENQ